eukprot:s1_g2084.t1
MKEKLLYLLGFIATGLYIVVPVIVFTASIAHADPLDGITIEREYRGGYDRDTFGRWSDDDRDGQNVRHEVLIEESLVPVTLSDDGRVVLSGLWWCPYTEKLFVTPKEDPNGRYAWLQIDHMVPLSEAYKSGAHAWSRAKRRAYYNDMRNPGHLIAVDADANRDKLDQDPASWMPDNRGFHCAYALTWVGIKRKWELSMDDDEAQALRTILAGCDVK